MTFSAEDQDSLWKHASTLEDWVIRMVESGQAKSPEFMVALEFWGREKFEAIWRAHIARKP